MGRLLVVVYVLLIVAFAVYGNWWGDFAYKGFAYNLGRSILWPTIIFPGLGEVVGGIAILCVIGFFILRRK